MKVRASDFAAFESVNSRYAGLIISRGLVLDPQVLPAVRQMPASDKKAFGAYSARLLSPGEGIFLA